MRVDLTETKKMINVITNNDRHLFSIFLYKLDIYYQERIQTLSLLTNWIFLLID